MVSFPESVSTLYEMLSGYPLRTSSSGLKERHPIPLDRVNFATEWAWLVAGFYTEFLRQAERLDNHAPWCLLVSSPTPSEFVESCGKIPVIFSEWVQNEKEYIELANWPLSNYPSDCLATVWNEVLIVSRSGNWMAKFNRASEDGFWAGSPELVARLGDVSRSF